MSCAETGFTSADATTTQTSTRPPGDLAALALLVREMRDQGTIIAASRRTFFDTEDYLKRARVFRQAVTSPCDFDQLHLMNWRKAEGISYLSKVVLDGSGFESPEVTYDEILVELNGQADHPMVSRPFLLTYLARMLLRFGGSPVDFIRRMDNPMEGVASVVKAFVDREVKEKWKSKETGEPYLTADQHIYCWLPWRRRCGVSRRNDSKLMSS
jgi:hypothetical protein